VKLTNSKNLNSHTEQLIVTCWFTTEFCRAKFQTNFYSKMSLKLVIWPSKPKRLILRLTCYKKN